MVVKKMKENAQYVTTHRLKQLGSDHFHTFIIIIFYFYNLFFCRFLLSTAILRLHGYYYYYFFPIIFTFFLKVE